MPKVLTVQVGPTLDRVDGHQQIRRSVAEVVLATVAVKPLVDVLDGMVQDRSGWHPPCPVVLSVLGSAVRHCLRDSEQPGGRHKVPSLWDAGSDGS